MFLCSICVGSLQWVNIDKQCRLRWINTDSVKSSSDYAPKFVLISLLCLMKDSLGTEGVKGLYKVLLSCYQSPSIYTLNAEKIFTLLSSSGFMECKQLEP